jgi:tetratricopeptide (TPR) repeat protein
MTEFELFKQANKLTQKGEWSNALKVYEKIVKKDPTDAYLWHKIGEMYEELENDKIAVMCFEKARSLGYSVDVEHILHEKR